MRRDVWRCEGGRRVEEIVTGLQHEPWTIPAMGVLGKILFGSLACWIALAKREIEPRRR